MVLEELCYYIQAQICKNIYSVYLLFKLKYSFQKTVESLCEKENVNNQLSNLQNEIEQQAEFEQQFSILKNCSQEIYELKNRFLVTANNSIFFS